MRSGVVVEKSVEKEKQMKTKLPEGLAEAW